MAHKRNKKYSGADSQSKKGYILQRRRRKGESVRNRDVSISDRNIDGFTKDAKYPNEYAITTPWNRKTQTTHTGYVGHSVDRKSEEIQDVEHSTYYWVLPLNVKNLQADPTLHSAYMDPLGSKRTLTTQPNTMKMDIHIHPYMHYTRTNGIVHLCHQSTHFLSKQKCPIERE